MMAFCYFILEIYSMLFEKIFLKILMFAVEKEKTLSKSYILKLSNHLYKSKKKLMQIENKMNFEILLYKMDKNKK